MYGNLKLNRVTHPNVDKMVDVINSGDYKGICDTVGNVLEDVTFGMHPEVARIKSQMKRFGADAVLMSGSIQLYLDLYTMIHECIAFITD